MKEYKLASSTWDKKELDAIQSVIDKDMYTMGDSVREFENDFSNFMNTKYSVMVLEKLLWVLSLRNMHLKN